MHHSTIDKMETSKLKSDLITLRNLQDQIQTGNHPIYKIKKIKKLNSEDHQHHHHQLNILPRSIQSNQSNLSNQIHPISYHHHPSLLHQTQFNLNHHNHNQDPIQHSNKPLNHHPISSSGTLNHYQQQPTKNDSNLPRYSTPNQQIQNRSLPANEPQSQSPRNSTYTKPYSIQKRSSIDSQPVHHEPSSDPRLIHNRTISLSDRHSHQSTRTFQPPTSNLNSLKLDHDPKHDRRPYTDPAHEAPIVETYQSSTRPNDHGSLSRSKKIIKSRSPPGLTTRQNDPKRRLQSDHPRSKQSSFLNDAGERRLGDCDPDDTSKNHLHSKSTRNQTQAGSKKSIRDSYIESTESEEETESDDEVEDEEMQKQPVDQTELGADQTRYQSELNKYHEELDIYQRKRKEREAVEIDIGITRAIGVGVGKKANTRRDSTDEYFKRSLETAGDPSSRNRRFSLAEDRSTLNVSSSTHHQSDTNEHLNPITTTITPLAETKFNPSSSSPEKETVEAANVLLGLGLSRATVTVNTTNTTTTPATSKTSFTCTQKNERSSDSN